MKQGPKGFYVPLITTFNDDESFDWDGYKKVIDYVIDNGMNGLLVGGSTGEYHMMSFEERKELIKKGCEFAAGRVPVMAGIGCFTAKDTIELGNWAAECGAEYGLVLPPYYMPTSDEGVVEFYKEIADNTKVGIVIYNNPLATGVELAPALIREIAMLDNVVSVKDTSEQIHTSQTVAATKDIEGFTVFQGYEQLLLPALSVGADGAFSIIFNLIPKEMSEMFKLAVEKNDFKAAMAINKNDDAVRSMKRTVSGPVKAGMDAIGMPGGVVRKPLSQPTDAMRAKMKAELKKIGYAVK